MRRQSWTTRTIDDAVTAAVAVCADQPDDLPFVAVYVGDGRHLRGATPSVLPFLPRTLAELTGGPQPGSRAAVSIIERVSSVIPGIHGVLGADCPRAGAGAGAGRGPDRRGAGGRNQARGYPSMLSIAAFANFSPTNCRRRSRRRSPMSRSGNEPTRLPNWTGPSRPF